MTGQAPPHGRLVPFRLAVSAPVVRTLLTLLGALLPVAVPAVGAQEVADSARRFRKVEIVRVEVYDSAEARVWYRRLANKVHVRTQERVVERELLLRAGDVRDSARIAETARNLRRLLVFRDVSVDTLSDTTALRFITRDGWTTRPYANFRSSGTQRLVSIGLLETNFLGLAATLDTRYSQDPDRSSLRFGVGAPRIIRSRVSTGMFYSRLTDGNSAGFNIEQPFFSLSSRTAIRLSGFSSDGRVLRFRDGILTPADSFQKRFSVLDFGAARAVRASPQGFVRLGTLLQWRREDYAPRRDARGPITKSVTGAATAYVDVSRARYLVRRNYRLMGQQEDIDLSTTVRLGMAVAPSVLGYAQNGIGPVLFAQTGMTVPHGFAVLRARANGITNIGARSAGTSAASSDSGTASVAATVVLQPHPQHTVVAFTSLGWDRNQNPGEEFDLGLQRGLRAFPLHAFVGNRQRFSMLEYRWTAVPRVFESFAAGVAAFAETGGAWYAGSRPRDGREAGVGLRVAPLRSADNNGVSRFDLVRRFATDRQPAGWVVVIGTGFPFDLLR